MSTAAFPTTRPIVIAGAGVMGRGIAAACLQSGFSVRLFDVDPGATAAAVSELQVSAGQLASDCPDSRLRPAELATDLRDAALLIESIPEQLSLKQDLFARAEEFAGRDTLFASNTSSFTLAQLTTGLRTPERVCGLHFCCPVAERPLVEIIAGRLTGQAALSKAERFISDLGKQGIVVQDSPGFVLNRLLSLYLNEALELLLEGATPEQLDQTAVRFGMPSGPLQQLDQFGLSVAMAVGRTMFLAFPDRWIASELLIAVCKASRREGRTQGQFLMPVQSAAGGLDANLRPTRASDDRQSNSASGDHGPPEHSGQQHHGAVQSCRLDPVARRILQERRRIVRNWSNEELEDRLWLPLFLEGTRMLEEGLVPNLELIDRILSLGLGLRPTCTGLTGWFASRGAALLAQRLDALQSLGPRFHPTRTLHALVRDLHAPGRDRSEDRRAA